MSANVEVLTVAPGHVFCQMCGASVERLRAGYFNTPLCCDICWNTYDGEYMPGIHEDPSPTNGTASFE